MVLVSRPDAVHALYTEPAHGLPPGRTVSLLPLVGPRSVLLLEGAEYLSRRRLMLGPFHGDRMRAHEPIMREAAAREIERWPADRPFPAHPGMQAITLEVILRAVFGLAGADRRERLRALLADLLAGTTSAALQLAVLVTRRFGARTRSPGSTRSPARSTRCCWPRSPRAAPTLAAPSATTSARCWSARASRTARRWTTGRSATSS